MHLDAEYVVSKGNRIIKRALFISSRLDAEEGARIRELCAYAGKMEFELKKINTRVPPPPPPPDIGGIRKSRGLFWFLFRSDNKDWRK